MTAAETYKKFEKLFEEFNKKLRELNIESKLFFHGSIELEITDLNYTNEHLDYSNEYHPKARRHFFKILPDIETADDVSDFLDKMYPAGEKNEQ